MSCRNIFLFLASLSFIPTLAFGKNCGHGDLRQEILNQVNSARAVSRFCGNVYYIAAAPMKWSAELENASAQHSEDMARQNFFSHQSLNGDTFADRIKNWGYQWTLIGENISAGRAQATDAINSWLKSPGHCANIMKSRFSEIGVACALEPASKYKYFWTMDLGHPRSR